MNDAAEAEPRRARAEARKGRRREQILEAATRLFAECGYADADTQLLAERLGVGKGTIYRYFPSKEEVFLAAADRVMVRLRDHVEACIAGLRDPLDQIAEAIRAYLAFFAANPHFAELLLQERAQFKDRKKPTYILHREANIERWRALYRALIAEGRVRDMPVERITDVLSDLLYGTMFTNYFAGRREPPEAQAEAILDVVFRGILSDPERRRNPGRRHPCNGS
jgi:AcrR family transcriptional regulator